MFNMFKLYVAPLRTDLVAFCVRLTKLKYHGVFYFWAFYTLHKNSYTSCLILL